MGIATIDYDRLRSIRDHAEKHRAQREKQRLGPAILTLYEAQSVGWKQRGRVAGTFSESFEFVLNETGEASVSLPGDHHMALWSARHWERDKDNVMIRLDKNGARWTGLLKDVSFDPEGVGQHTCTLTFLHDYEQLKCLPVFSNPLTPVEIQIPEPWQMLAPAAWNLKLLGMLNAARSYSILSGLPDDPLNFESWLSQWDWRRWPMIFTPGSVLKDSTPIRYLSAETGQTWDDVAQSLLTDCRLMVQIRRWFPGDPDPWPGARLSMPGQIVVDIVDKSGWWEDTFTGGTILHGAARTILEVADDGVEEIRRAIDRKSESGRYPVSGFLGVDPKVPAVSYRTTGPHATAKASWSWSPATVGQITVGGSSMPGINESLSAGTKLLFNLLGSFLLMPGFGSVANEFIEPIYRDRFMAWMQYKLNLRTMQLGHGHYIGAVKGGEQAYTLPAFLAARELARATEEQTGTVLQIEDVSPFVIGDQGQGHFFLGDRIGYEVPVSRDGRMEFGQVVKLVLTRTANEPYSWEPTVGDWPRRDFADFVLGEMRRIVGGMKKGGFL